LSISQEITKKKRVFFLIEKAGFSEGTIEKIRMRNLRARFQKLTRLGKPLKILLFVALIAALSYVAIVQLKYIFFGTSYFEIKQIEVVGLQSLKKDEILKLAGVAPGINIMNFDREEAGKRLLMHPYIKKVSVEFSGLYTIKINIEERSAMFYAKIDTSFWDISDDGVIISTESLGENNLPIITGLSLTGKTIGDSILENDGFHEAGKWVKTLGPRILDGISEINFSNFQNPYVFLISGERVIPKNLDDFKERYDFLRALLDNLKKNRVEPEYLDMRAPNDIVFRPKRAKKNIEGSRSSVVGG